MEDTHEVVEEPRLNSEEHRFTLATGTSTSLGDLEAEVTITGAAFLYAVTVNLAASSPPIRVAISVRQGGTPSNQLGSAWVSGSAVHPGTGGSHWDGKLPLNSRSARIFIAARNDTGATVTVIWSHTSGD